ncbi:N-6 DNA methylase [Sphaerisporangium sp. NPDC051017]|uniref:N-6 DNA methylase n=1 Tax=Sphaerisporangium sp. NPDC051017 TaxID=3154636 RepID=UPI00342E6B29
MGHDAMLNAGDIARLADVGRAAVSNWRRRYDDFPQPVGGTAASPLFSLPEVEDWLRRNGKSYEMSLGDRVWQRLRASGDDLRLGERVGCAGAFLLYLRRDPGGWKGLARAPELVEPLPEAAATAVADLPVPVAWDLIDARLYRLLADLAAEQGPADAFELLFERYVEAHSRRLPVTRPEIADVITRLTLRDLDLPPTGDDATGHARTAEGERSSGTGTAATVLDPACGIGALLIPFADARVLGQDGGDTTALLTAVRLLLRGAHAEVVAGDSLRQDGFPSLRADVVVCDPPFNERAWGYEELTGDPRWEYGLPPRGEPELAWVQHCLAHVRPGGLVAILMPPAAASRRPGKRIRGNLLRAGALRAVITLQAGGPDLWLLRRPGPGERPPSSVLLMDASVTPPQEPSLLDTVLGPATPDPSPGARPGPGGPPSGAPPGPGGPTPADVASRAEAERPSSPVEAAWLAFTADPEAQPTGPYRAVRIIDLLDDEVDLSPTRHLPPHADEDQAAGFVAIVGRFREAAAALPDAPPSLGVLAEPRDLPSTTIGELVRAGLVTIHQGQPKMAAGPGEVPVLTVADLAAGGPPSGRTSPDPAHVTLEPGDVVAAGATGEGAARTVTEGGAVLGPQLYLYRVDPERMDPDFLAGFLRYAGAWGTARSHPGASRVDARRVRIPRLSLAEQRIYGKAFRELLELEDRLRETAALGEALIRLGFDGLVGGHLRPSG